MKTNATSGRNYRVLDRKPKKAKGRKESSRRWIARQLNDPFVVEARKRGFRSRSALKLEQIDKKYKIFRAGQTVLDLGCAPGGWLQYTAGRIGLSEGKGYLLGVDLLEVEPIAGAKIINIKIIRGDIADEAVLAEVKQLLGTPSGCEPSGFAPSGCEPSGCDVVLSDMAATTTGHRATDHLRTTALLDLALDSALQCLKPNGIFLAKCFRGGAEKNALTTMHQNFKQVRHIKPPASRQESVETYILGVGHRGGVP